MIPPDGLYLRAAPSTQSAVLDLVLGGAQVALTGTATSDGWHAAVVKGKKGWMFGEFLNMPSDAASLTRRATVRAVDGAHLYNEPHTTAVRLATVSAGTSVTVSTRATSDGWVIAAHAGFTGWAAAGQVQIEGTPATPPAPATPSVSAAPSGAVRATITYYHPSLEGGGMACGGRYRAEDPTIAAATSWPCGTRLRVCRNSACIVVTVQDSGHMGPNWVDLSASAFRQLAPLADMLVTGTVEVLPPGP